MTGEIWSTQDETHQPSKAINTNRTQHPPFLLFRMHQRLTDMELNSNVSAHNMCCQWELKDHIGTSNSINILVTPTLHNQFSVFEIVNTTLFKHNNAN